MQFPVTEEFVTTANAAQLHSEAGGDSPEWPASFVQLDDGSWVYRIDDVDVYVDDDDDGNPVACTRPRAGVAIDAARVSAAIEQHQPLPPPQTTEERLADALARIAVLEQQLGL